MISNSANSYPHRTNSRWQTLAIILVFLLLAVVIWRWFDYQIARLTFPQHNNVSGMVIYKTSNEFDASKTLSHE